MENPQPPTRPIRRQLAVAVALPLLVLLVLAGGLAWQVHSLLTEAAWVEHTDEVLASTNALQTEILNMQTGVRGFLLTRDASFIEPFTDGAQALHGKLDALQSMTTDNPMQVARLHSLKNVIDEWRDRAQAILRADATDLPSLLVTGEQQMRDIRARIGDILQAETGLRHERAAKVERTKRATAIFGSFSVLLAAAVVALITQRQLFSVAREYDRALGVERKAVQVRDVFLTVASHELRTPLTSLKLQVERLVRFLPEQCDSPKVTRSLVVIQRQMGRMEKLITQLLDISQMSNGMLPLEWTTADLSAVVRECVADLRDEARVSGHELVVEAPASLPGETDLLRFRQIVVNLVANALKFGEQKPIRVSLTPVDGHLRLTVEDRGIGISHADQERIFQQFEQAVSSMSYGGFGIGLWMVRAFTEAMGGTVQVRSEQGSGATFTVELPLRHVEENPGPENVLRHRSAQETRAHI